MYITAIFIVCLLPFPTASAPGDLFRTYTGHTDDVYSVFVSGNYLFSGSYDNTIKQWDITSGVNVRNYTGHTDWVNSVVVNGNYLFSGSNDNKIKQWDTTTGVNTHTFTGHTNYVMSVFVSGNYLFSGAQDNTNSGRLEIWL